MSQLKWLQDWVAKNNIEVSDEQIADLRSTYEAAATKAEQESQAPRESTRNTQLQSLKDTHEVNRDHVVKSIPGLRGTMEVHAEGRGIRKQQDTDQTMTVMGGSYRDMLNDGLDSKDKTFQGMIDYYNQRDARYADLVRSQHGLANKGMTMDLIGKLVGGAAMLAG